MTAGRCAILSTKTVSTCGFITAVIYPDIFLNISMTSKKNPDVHDTHTARVQSSGATAAYCAELQRWMWRCYWGNVSWQSWMTLSTFPCLPPPHTSAQTPAAPATMSWDGYPASGPPASSPPHRGGAQTDDRSGHQQNGSPHQAGRALSLWPDLNKCHPDVMSVVL